MTQQELQDIEERWKFGTNTREDVLNLLDEVREWKITAEQYRSVSWILMDKFGVKTVNAVTGEIVMKDKP